MNLNSYQYFSDVSFEMKKNIKHKIAKCQITWISVILNWIFFSIVIVVAIFRFVDFYLLCFYYVIWFLTSYVWYIIHMYIWYTTWIDVNSAANKNFYLTLSVRCWISTNWTEWMPNIILLSLSFHSVYVRKISFSSFQFWMLNCNVGACISMELNEIHDNKIRIYILYSAIYSKVFFLFDYTGFKWKIWKSLWYVWVCCMEEK